MTVLVDLAPTVSRKHWPQVEAVCERIEELGDQPFSRPSLAAEAQVTVGHLTDLGLNPAWGTLGNTWSAAVHVIQAYLALGFIERISEEGARPVYFRVLPHAMPKRVPA